MSKSTPVGNATPKKRIAVIDADGILYAAALGGETFVEGLGQFQTLDISKVYRDCLARIEEQVEMVKADDAFIILSARKGHRFELLATYKANRAGSPRPLLLDELRGKIMDEAPYRTMLIEGLEADDTCGIAAGHLNANGREAVIVSPDKDLLQVPGLVFTVQRYDPKRPHSKGVWSEVTPATADRWHLYQTLVGDAVDNYKGCPGIGPSKAEAFLEACDIAELRPSERWEEVVNMFLAAGLTAEDALTQARVARILRVEDWDADAKEVRLWVPPGS